MKLDNRAVAQLFDDLGSLLELGGESAFRVNAYLESMVQCHDGPD
jgi:DNA polymerase/3'-5' exonuclease PolX